jgi:hypothetical protein
LVQRLALPGQTVGDQRDASGNNTVLQAKPGTQFYVFAIVFTCSANVDVAFISGITTLVAAMSFAKYGGPGVNQQPAACMPLGGENEAWIMNLSARQTCAAGSTTLKFNEESGTMR